jgi:hypothetical protein
MPLSVAKAFGGYLNYPSAHFFFSAPAFYVNRMLRCLIFDSRPVFNAGIVVMFYFLNFANGVGNLDYFFGCVTAR